MLRRPSVQLFIISFLILFFELAMIRWVPANIFYVGYFTNFILLACLLGIGLGCLGGRWRWHPFSLFPIAAFVVVAAVAALQVDVAVQAKDQLHFQTPRPQETRLSIWVILPLLFAMVTGLFVCLAQPLGRLLKSLPPLRAYTINIAGSLAGIAAFTLSSFLWLPPIVWFAVCLALFLLVDTAARRWRFWQVTTSCACLVILSMDMLGETHWSPYQRLNVAPDPPGAEEPTGWLITANGIAHQCMMTLDNMGNMYHTPYAAFGGAPGTFEDILVIGAGSGGDVAIALSYGAKHVDAVDIDPLIVELGRRFHPCDPYKDPRVHVHVNDGRAFLEQTSKKYDLIAFGLPDSLTLSSAYANLRLENFLFTMECFRTVRGRLKENGLFVLYNYYRERWYIQKLAKMLAEVFGQKPAVYVDEADEGLPGVLMVGPRMEQLPDLAWPPEFKEDDSLTNATDDWPFTYMRKATIPGQYLLMFLVLGLFAAVSVRVARPKEGGRLRSSSHFFFMGAGFFLLEARSLVQFALLFGTTWMVNSLVFFAILVAVLIANAIVARFQFRRAWPLCLGLGATLLLNFLLPLEALLLESWFLRYVIASAVIFSPIFFANLLFSRFFRDTKAADLGFAANLLGTLVGGMMEYVSLVTGYQNLMAIVAAFYVLALATAPWKQADAIGGPGP